jgi:hypothetical protein
MDSFVGAIIAIALVRVRDRVSVRVRVGVKVKVKVKVRVRVRVRVSVRKGVRVFTSPTDRRPEVRIPKSENGKARSTKDAVETHVPGARRRRSKQLAMRTTPGEESSTESKIMTTTMTLVTVGSAQVHAWNQWREERGRSIERHRVGVFVWSCE